MSEDYFHDHNKDESHSIALFFVFFILIIINTIVSIYCCRFAIYVYLSEQQIRNPDAGIVEHVRFVNHEEDQNVEMEIAGEV